MTAISVKLRAHGLVVGNNRLITREEILFPLQESIVVEQEYKELNVVVYFFDLVRSVNDLNRSKEVTKK